MVKKHINRGITSWCFVFDASGSTREERRRIRKFGFKTKKAAEDAEVTERAKFARSRSLADPAAQPPTLDVLLEKFFQLHCEGTLSPKTVERYRDHRSYLAADLVARPPQEIGGPHLTAEWKRLLREGGHTRTTKTPRPLSAKTVRHIASVVSSAYNWGKKQGFGMINPVQASELPKAKKKRAVTVENAQLVISCPRVSRTLRDRAGSFWCQAAYLAAADALGARRGELLALRWGDLKNGRFVIERNLIQFKDPATGETRLEFKSTKEDEIHDVSVPASLMPVLEEHRQKQNELRRQFGPDYRDHDLIFAAEDGGPLKPDSVSASVSALCRALKLPKGTSLHSLRHTHASVLLAKGVALTTVSKRLGHATVRTTADIYSHVLRDEDDKAAAAYDDYRRKQEAERTDDRVQ